MSYLYLLPDVYFFSSIFIYILSFFFERNIKFLFFFLLQIILFLIVMYVGLPTYNFFYSFLYSISGFVFVIKLLVLIFFLVFIIVFYNYLKSEVDSKHLIDSNNFIGFFEYSLITLLFIFSGFFFISVNDMLLVYVFLELQSLCLYVLAAFGFESIRSAEASLKYFFFGAQFSGLFILGWIFLYYNTGLSNFLDYFDYFYLFKKINKVFGKPYLDKIIICSFGAFLLVFSLVCKLGLFPAYFWMVDVYDGSSNISVFFFSVFPKLILVTFLARLHVIFEPLLQMNLFLFFYMFVAIGSILFCSVLNFSQWRIKRFMAFSSVVNLGYIILFFTCMNISEEFFVGLFLNLFAYITLVSSFFIIYLNLRILNRSVNNVVSDINELFLLKNSGNMGAFLIGLIMLSFAGVPPLLGFFGKFYLLIYLIEHGAPILVALVLLGSLLSSFYYIRLARILFNFNSGFLIVSGISGFIYFLLFILLFIQIFFSFIFYSYLPVIHLFISVFA